MPWQMLRIAAAEGTAEALSDALLEAGALSASIEDADAGTPDEQAIFGEPGMPGGIVWRHAVVAALVAGDANPGAILASACDSLALSEPTFLVEAVPETDWVRETQSQFDPIPISSRLWIVPSWHEAPDKGAINLRLDPGLAFGTGSHPTTRLCLRWLDENLRTSESVLDYGCGSGILAIAAMKLGAGMAVGVDIDEQAILASRFNAEQNQVVAAFNQPEALSGKTYDLVLANILSNPLRALAPLLAGATRSGGRLAISGVLLEQADEIGAIYAQWFDMAPTIEDDGWVCLTGVKR